MARGRQRSQGASTADAGNPFGAQQAERLARDLAHEWRLRQEGGWPQSNPPPADSELRQFYGEEQDVLLAPKFSMYLGRVVLSKNLKFVAGQWKEMADEIGITFLPIRQPLGIRYLGYYTLQALKEYKKSPTGEDPLNPHAHEIHKFSDILEFAKQDPEFDSGVAFRNIEVRGRRVAVQNYPNGTLPHAVVIGIGIGRESNECDKPPEAAPSCSLERAYFSKNFDPYVDPKFIPHREVYIPMGWISDAVGPTDARIVALQEAAAGPIHSKIVLGPVEFTDRLLRA